MQALVAALVLAPLLVFATEAAGPGPALPAVAWKPPVESTIAWRGVPSLDESVDRPGGMMYPAPSLLGFLAAVMTHAAISSSVQSAEQERREREADGVLGPMAPLLSAWTAQALWQSALTSPAAPAGASLQATDDAQVWRAEATPRFSLAPSAGTLVLDLGARITPPGRPALELMVRVVSMPSAAADAGAHWAAEDGRALREITSSMLAHALDLATREAGERQIAPAPPAEPAFRTHRYRFGQLQRAERAQRTDERCGRLVLRTLRGGLLSVPAWAPLATSASAAAAAASSPASAASAAAEPAGESACRALAVF